MQENGDRTARRHGQPGQQGQPTPLGRLIDQLSTRDAPALGGEGQAIWQRLDLDRIARRLIQTARIAAGEHALQRAEELIRLRDQAAMANPGTDNSGRPATA